MGNVYSCIRVSSLELKQPIYGVWRQSSLQDVDLTGFYTNFIQKTLKKGCCIEGDIRYNRCRRKK